MNKLLLTVSSVAAATALSIGGSCTPTTTNTNTATTNTTVNTNTVAAAVFNPTASHTLVLADVNGQWASGATASSEYGSDSWAAKQATGAPDVDVFGDNSSAWAPLEKNKGLETLELTYTKAVYASGVRIRENLGDGAVTLVELKDVDGTYHMVWINKTDGTTGLNYLQIPIQKTTYKVNGVRISLNTTLSPDDWAEIDAVQLVGE